MFRWFNKSSTLFQIETFLQRRGDAAYSGTDSSLIQINPKIIGVTMHNLQTFNTLGLLFSVEFTPTRERALCIFWH